MDLEVKLFVPRRIVCEAAKITDENIQQIRNWTSGDREVQEKVSRKTVGRWVVRRCDSKFELMTEGQLWGLYEPLIH